MQYSGERCHVIVWDFVSHSLCHNVIHLTEEQMPVL